MLKYKGHAHSMHEAEVEIKALKWSSCPELAVFEANM